MDAAEDEIQWQICVDIAEHFLVPYEQDIY
jgi:hypothetical protein